MKNAMKYKPFTFPKDVIEDMIGASEYIKITSAPATVTVTIKVGDTSNGGVVLDPDEFMEFEKADKVYVTIEGLLAGESVELVSAVGKFKIGSDSEKSTVGSYDSNALVQLDKIMNPYEYPDLSYGQSTSAITVTLLNKTLTCDKIKIKLIMFESSVGDWSDIKVTLGGVAVVASIHAYDRDTGAPNDYIELEDVRGLNLLIQGRADAAGYISYSLQEYTLKA